MMKSKYSASDCGLRLTCLDQTHVKQASEGKKVIAEMKALLPPNSAFPTSFSSPTPYSETHFKMPHFPKDSGVTTKDAAKIAVTVKNRRKRYLDSHPEYFSAELELAGPPALFSPIASSSHKHHRTYHRGQLAIYTEINKKSNQNSYTNPIQLLHRSVIVRSPHPPIPNNARERGRGAR